MLAEQVLDAARKKGWMLTIAESCTGGMVSAALTDVAGSSDVFERGFITYSNEAKTELLGVAAELINEHGAVSEPVARAMAEGALKHSQGNIAVSLTGVAGPGASENKPAGLVFIGLAMKDGEEMVEQCQFEGNRTDVRQQATSRALELLLDIMC